MAWALLVLAAVFEIAFALTLKSTEGFTRLIPSAAVVAFAVMSVVLLSKTLNVLPVGTAYAAWTGIGSVGVVALGIAFYDEPISILRLGCIALIIVSVIGLHFTESG